MIIVTVVSMAKEGDCENGSGQKDGLPDLRRKLIDLKDMSDR